MKAKHRFKLSWRPV